MATDPRQMVQLDVSTPGVLTMHSWLPVNVAEGIWPAIAAAWFSSDGARVCRCNCRQNTEKDPAELPLNPTAAALVRSLEV